MVPAAVFNDRFAYVARVDIHMAVFLVMYHAQCTGRFRTGAVQKSERALHSRLIA
jgi:hypothetical protein